MKETVIDFIKKFMNISHHIRDDSQELLHSWKPDFPPITVILSFLGKSLFNNYELLSDHERSILFNEIELGINSENKILSDAMATGLIEALVNCSFYDKKKWEKIKKMLGPESKKYAMIWHNLG